MHSGPHQAATAITAGPLITKPIAALLHWATVATVGPTSDAVFGLKVIARGSHYKRSHRSRRARSSDVCRGLALVTPTRWYSLSRLALSSCRPTRLAR